MKDFCKKKKKSGLTLLMVVASLLLLANIAIISLKVNGLQKEIQATQSQVKELNNQVRTCITRIHLLGVLHNENWAIYRDASQQDVMFLKFNDQKWYIEQMPRHLYMDYTTRKYIEETHLR